MKLSHFKISFIAILLIVTIIFASAAVGRIIVIPEAPQYSEIYILGPGGKAENLPFNISEGQQYSIYLGVGNHKNSAQTYLIDLKIRNQTQSLPVEATGVPSELPTAYQYNVFVEKGKGWQTQMHFSVSSFSSSSNESYLKSLTVDGSTANVNLAAAWDTQNKGYYYQVLFELWTLNPDTAVANYQNRYVYFWMNVTSTAHQPLNP